MSAAFKLLFNVLYPAYSTFKAFRSKKAGDYIKWMMYWIVFAVFNFVEIFTDVLLFWLPFYSEVKILMLLWLIIPVWKDTLGSGLIYKKLVHPFLVANEQKIDEILEKLRKEACNVVSGLLLRLFRMVSDFVLQHAFAAMITSETAAPVPGQNCVGFSSDSEAEDQQPKLPAAAKKSLRRKKTQKK